MGAPWCCAVGYRVGVPVITIGIDPGITGAVSCFGVKNELCWVEDLPMIKVAVGKGYRTQMVPATLAQRLYELTAGSSPVHAYLEQVASRPGEGAVGAFSFGVGFGMIQGVLAALRIPYTLVTPAKWKKSFGLAADKGLARMRASREFPEFASQFSRVKDDGRAEACLIGLYGVNAQ